MTTIKEIYTILEEVADPEVPVLSILDLGIVRNIEIGNDNKITVFITPTYTGCPAMDMICMNIRMKFLEMGIKHFEILLVLSPAWTTDWMTEIGKQKLKDYGIAPPQFSVKNKTNELEAAIICPSCNSNHTKLLSAFGSTACKALYQCNDCKEPFDYFKCH